ncbi:unnamed protein product, partial [Mesorhabditis belari]|uniref:Tyrosine-protein kinase n=1 Tax=Mesorhabditis belari TaxID=2138241 RepID=A0AAF3EU01_9BILA
MGWISPKSVKKKATGLTPADEKEEENESDRDDLSECSYQSSNEASVIQQNEYNTDRDPDADLRNLDCFHGFLPRWEAEEILMQTGDYLVRKKEQNDEVVTILSIRAEQTPPKFWHLIVPKVEDKWMVTDSLAITDLGVYLSGKRNDGQPILENDQRSILRHSIPRQAWELRSNQVQLGKKVGEGAFGEVFLGTLQLDTDRSLPVAVKRLKNVTVLAEQKEQFVSEARLCRRLHHENIVKFRGVMVEKTPFLMVLEWADGGSLLDALRKFGSTYNNMQKTLFCVQAAQGFRYLEKNRIIHRDIAARNCLIGSGRVKVSDFGLSLFSHELRKIDLTTEILPIRWLAPETFSSWVFSNKTDVYSFGVMMWEVFALGRTPYSDLDSKQVAQGVLGGMYLQPPRDTPDGVSNLILLCQSNDPMKRPNFLKLKLHLRKEYDKLAGRRGFVNFFKKKTY